MSSKSIIFIEPAANKTNVYDKYMRLPLMGSLYLGTILSNHGYDVRIINENIQSKALDPFEIRADVFCITALTVSANRAKLLSSQLKRIYPASTIIIGGIHASLLPEDFTEVADHVVIGEAEEIILDIVEGKFAEQIIHGTQLADLDQLPMVNYDLLEGADQLHITPIMTSRGCPFDCSFCTVTKIFGRKFRMQSAKRVLAEIEHARTHFNAKSFFIYDDNFSANKNRVHELCDLMKERNSIVPLSAQVRTDLANDPELVHKMAQVGLKWVYVGFESIHDATLQALHKSQTRADIEQAIRCFHHYGVNIHGMFMFGEDHDTTESIQKTVDFAIEQQIDTVQFMILTPFPGTQCYDSLLQEQRLFHTNWDYYNAMFAVFQPKHISPERLIYETYAAYRKFYSVSRTLMELLSILFHVTLDALAWNFQNTNRYSLDHLFLRIGAKTIVSQYADIYGSYVKYLTEIERKTVLKQID